MQRIITDPAGCRWDVHIEWVGRRLGRQTVLGRWSARRARRGDRKAARAEALRTGRPQPREGKRSRWRDRLDFDPGCFALDELLVVVVIVAIVVALIWFGPGVVALLLGLGELLLVALAAVVVATWRTVTRRPWSVVARSDQVERRWSVVGYKRARRMVSELSGALRDGRPLAEIDEAHGNSRPVLDKGEPPDG